MLILPECARRWFRRSSKPQLTRSSSWGSGIDDMHCAPSLKAVLAACWSGGSSGKPPGRLGAEARAHLWSSCGKVVLAAMLCAANPAVSGQRVACIVMVSSP